MTGSRRALLVEGYVDCLMAHQHGFGEAVAVLGTALTPAQLGLLRRYADEAILFFDADRAGQEAARRAEELLEQSTDPGAVGGDPTGERSDARPPPEGRHTARRPRSGHLPPGRGPRGLRGPLPRSPASPPLRARPRVRRGGHGRPAGPRHRHGPRRPHAVEGPGRRRGHRARPRGRPAPRHRPERPLEPGPTAGHGDRPPGDAGARRCAGRAPAGVRVRARPRAVGRPDPGGSGGAPAAPPAGDGGASRGAGDRRGAACPPRGPPRRARPAARRRRARSSARWLVEEREWPDLAAHILLMQRRLARRQAQRRVRELTQTIAQSEATGAAADFASLQSAIGLETPRIRADARGSP